MEHNLRTNVGIWGVGTCLPEEIRRNDWWPEAVVARWREKRGYNLPSLARWAEDPAAGEAPDGVRKTIEAILEIKDDPFQGARERRVAADGVTASELETRAARAALERAQVDASEIDFVLSYSAVPDYLCTTNACAVHKSLGLPERCLSLAVEGACNTFLLQLTVAEQLIASGRFRRGLLVLSSIGSRVLPPEQPGSAIFGDGAAAVVVGPVAEGYGILGRASRTDGTRHRAVVIGVPGARWHDEGRNVFYAEDPQLGRGLILAAADNSRGIVKEALAEAGRDASEVDFYACHQGTAWLRRLTQDLSGCARARTVDTFPWVTSLMGANIPLVLSIAEHEGTLKDGDLVAGFSGGLGETWSSVVLRWGRG